MDGTTFQSINVVMAGFVSVIYIDGEVTLRPVPCDAEKVDADDNVIPEADLTSPAGSSGSRVDTNCGPVAN